MRDHAVAGGDVYVFVFDGRGIRSTNCFLALGERVSPPFTDATGVEVVKPAPAASDVSGVVGTPGTRAEPLIPVHFVLWWFGFRRQPIVSHFGRLPRGDVSANGVHLAQPADVEWRIWRAPLSGREAAGRGPPAARGFEPLTFGSDYMKEGSSYG